MTTETNKNGSLLEIVQEWAASETLKLPVFPDVARDLYGIMSNEDASINEVAAVIAKDQALAAQMLKVANSSFFAGLNKVRTIRESIMRLGVNQVFNYLVAGSQKDFYLSKDPLIGKLLQVLWKHALATAKGSQWLLRKTGYSELADEGFLAGLFHDIGKLLLLKVLESIKTNAEIPISEPFIFEVLDSMHVEQGFKLMTEWNIPEIYCEVVKNHHEEEFDNTDSLLIAVRITDHVCAKTGVSLDPDPGIVTATLPEVHSMTIKEIVLAELEVVIEDALEAGP